MKMASFIHILRVVRGTFRHSRDASRPLWSCRASEVFDADAELAQRAFGALLGKRGAA
jgi:hypothetical protein